MCDTDEDMDGIPDEALNCTGDPRCAKVKLQRKYKKIYFSDCSPQANDSLLSLINKLERLNPSRLVCLPINVTVM